MSDYLGLVQSTVSEQFLLPLLLVQDWILCLESLHLVDAGNAVITLLLNVVPRTNKQ